MKNVKKSRSKTKRQSSMKHSMRIDREQNNQHWRMTPIAAAVMCACYSGFSSPVVQAQDSTTIEEIIVSAQRREQNIQDSP